MNSYSIIRCIWYIPGHLCHIQLDIPHNWFNKSLKNTSLKNVDSNTSVSDVFLRYDTTRKDSQQI